MSMHRHSLPRITRVWALVTSQKPLRYYVFEGPVLGFGAVRVDDAASSPDAAAAVEATGIASPSP